MVPAERRPEAQSGGEERGSSHDLFGRGLLYVIVWASQLIVATVVSPVLAHNLAAAAFGRLATAIALFQLLMVVAVFGLDQALEIQRVEDGADASKARGLITWGLVLSVVLVSLLWVGVPVWAPQMGFRPGEPLVFLTLLWTAPAAAVMVCLALLQAEDRLRQFSTVSLLASVGSQLIGISLLFLVGRTPETYALGGVIGEFGALALGLWWCRPAWRGLLDLVTLRRALVLGWPLVLTNLAQFVLNASDRFVIQRWLGAEEVARYQIAFTVGNVMTLLLGFTHRAWVPRLKSISEPAERWRTITAAREGLLWLLGWVLLGITISAPPLLRVFAPLSYRLESLPIIVFLVGLCALPVADAAASSQMLITMRNSRPMSTGALAAVVVKIAATLGGLLVFGLPGAAAATLLAFCAQAAWVRYAVSRDHASARMQPATVVFLALAVVIAGVSTCLPQSLWWNVARFTLSCLCVPFFFRALRLLQQGALPTLRMR